MGAVGTVEGKEANLDLDYPALYKFCFVSHASYTTSHQSIVHLVIAFFFSSPTLQNKTTSTYIVIHLFFSLSLSLSLLFGWVKGRGGYRNKKKPDSMLDPC